MKFIKIKLFSVLLLVLLSISAVNAAENITDDVIADDNTGTFTDLQNLIDKTETGTVELTGNYTYSSNDNLISVARDNLTINGNGAVIDAKGAELVLNVTGSNVVLNNVSIVNAVVGSIKTTAIAWEGDDGVLANSTISNNTVTDVTLSQLVMWRGHNALIDNCIFENNYYKLDELKSLAFGSLVGSLYMCGDNSTVSNSVFKNNSALYGAAIYWDGDNGILVNSTFINNIAWYGGAVYWIGDNGSVSKSKFNNNTATFRGGAIYWYSQDNGGEITTSIFLDNNATSGEAIAIGSDTFINIENVVFINNDLNDANIVNATTDTASATANANWWGNTADDLTTAPNVYGNVTVDNWLFLNVTANPTDIYESRNSTITFDLTHTSDADGNIGEVESYDLLASDVVVTDVVGGTVNTTSIEFSDGVGEIFYRAGSEGNGSLEVNVLGLDFTFNFTIKSLKIEVSCEDIYVGQNATVTISLPSDATGIAAIYLNGTLKANLTVENNRTLTISNLDIGTYYIEAVYGGDNNCPASEANTTFNVLAKITDYDLNVTQNDTSLIITLPEDADGNVSVVIANNTYSAEISDGQAIVDISGLSSGTYTANIIYAGNEKYDSKSTTTSVLVKVRVNITAPSLEMYYKNGSRFVISLTGVDGNILSNRTLTIKINGVNYTRTTNASGIVSMAVNLNSGTYNVTVSYAGDDYYSSASTDSQITVKATISAADITKIYRNSTQFYATFVDGQGNLLTNTNVTFNINGVYYTRATNASGVARLNINLNPGTYIITSINPKTNENAANNVTVIASICENSDVVKYFRNSTQFWARILGDDGNPVGEGVNVSFNINGVFYTRTTNASGYVRLNINLNPGSYILTTEYNGLKASNNITVLPVLSANNLTMKYRDGSVFTAKLVDGSGNAYANQNVTFNINGVFYNRVTNSSGIASLNINLMAGEYIITSTYGYANIANKITISA